MTRQREPRTRDKAYMGFVGKLPCVACACGGVVRFGVECAHNGLAIAAHGWREAGVQEKAADRRVLPLCERHHRGDGGEHMSGMRQFWDRLGICPACLSSALSDAYDAGEDGTAALWAAVKARRLDGEPTC